MSKNRNLLLATVATLTITTVVPLAPLLTNATSLDSTYKAYTKEDSIKKGAHFILGKDTRLLGEFESGRWGLHGTFTMVKGTGLEVIEIKEGYMNFEDDVPKGEKKPPKRKFIKVLDVVENKEYWLEQEGFFAQQVVKQEAYLSGYQLYFTYGYNVEVHTKKDLIAYRGYVYYNNTTTFKGANKSEIKKGFDLTYHGIVFIDGDYYVKTDNGNHEIFYIIAKDLGRGLAQQNIIVEEQPTDIEEQEVKDDIIETNVELNPNVAFISSEKIKNVFLSRSNTRGLYNEIELPSNTPLTYIKDITTLGETVAQIKEVNGGKLYYLYKKELYALSNIKLYGQTTDVYKDIQGESALLTRNASAYDKQESNGKLSGKYAMKKGVEVTIKGYTTNVSGKESYAKVTLGVSSKVYYVQSKYLTTKGKLTELNDNTRITTKFIEFNKSYKGYKNISVKNKAITKSGASNLNTKQTYAYKSQKTINNVVFIRVQDTKTKEQFYIEKAGLSVILKDTDT